MGFHHFFTGTVFLIFINFFCCFFRKRPTISASPAFRKIFCILFTVVVNQTAFENDFSLIVCELAECYLELFQGVSLNGVALDYVCFFLNCFTDSREEQEVSVLKRKVSGRNQEWKHTPVDQVRAISLGCVLVGNVCPAAKYLLAGRCLLSGRTVTRFHCKNSASYTKIGLVYLRIGFVNGLKNRFQFRNCLNRTVACLNCFLCCLDRLRTANVLRIFSGECELCKSKRIGTVRGCLTGWNQLVSCGRLDKTGALLYTLVV